MKNCNKSNWNKILYGEKPLRGILTREEIYKIREDFRKNMKMRKFKWFEH